MRSLAEAERLVETRKRNLGAEDECTLGSMGDLAWFYMKQDRWEEAEELEVQVMETCKRVHGPKHRDTLTSMANLVLIYRN
jgi:Tetratricopeptide repeat